MKKLFLLAGVALLGLSACQNEEVSVTPTGEETSVNFTATLAGETEKSRVAIDETGNGQSADRCILQVYEKNGNDYEAYGEQVKADVTAGKASFSNVRVISGKTYKFVFWADKSNNKEDLYYNTADLRNIQLKGDYTVNTDDRDAFFGSTEVNVTSTLNEVVELKRPFGQINLTTKDAATVPEAKRPNKVKITYTAAGYTALDALTGDVLGEPATSQMSLVANAMDAATGYELMDYLFAPANDEMLVDFSTEFYKDATLITSNSQTTNIPVRRNWRTNITGNFLTDGANFNVVIAPGFDGVYPQVFDLSTPDEVLNAGGWWIVNNLGEDPGSGYIGMIDLSKINPEKDLVLTIAQTHGSCEIIVGNNKEIANHITIKVEPGVKVDFVTSYTKFGKNIKSTVLNNLTLVGDASAATKVGFASADVTTVKNVTFDGLSFSGKGIKFGDGVQNLENLTVKNCTATDLTQAFVWVSAKNSSNISITDNNIKFAPEDKLEGDRVDGSVIWYMNGGKLEFSRNNVTGGSGGFTSIPGAVQKSPAETIVEDNTFYNDGGAVTIQQPHNKIAVRNNRFESDKSGVVFMLYKAANKPDIEVIGNYFRKKQPAVAGAGSSTSILAYGYATKWGDNDLGCTAKFVCKDNVKDGTMDKNWAGWFAPASLSKNPVTFSEGSDVTKPFKN